MTAIVPPRDPAVARLSSSAPPCLPSSAGIRRHVVWSAAIIAGLLIYTGFFAVGLGPVFWLLINEIYPVRIRGRAMSVAAIANRGANFNAPWRRSNAISGRHTKTKGLSSDDRTVQREYPLGV